MDGSEDVTDKVLRNFFILPTDAILHVFHFCDVLTLCRLAQVCRRIRQLIENDCVWIRIKKQLNLLLIYSSINEYHRISLKKQCKKAITRPQDNAWNQRMVFFKKKQMPCLQLKNGFLFVSSNDSIQCYKLFGDGGLKRMPHRQMKYHAHDVSCIKVNKKFMVSSSSDGSLCTFDVENSKVSWHQPNAHADDIHAVDIQNSIIVTGCRDSSIRIWNTQMSDKPLRTLDAADRVWSIALSCDTRTFISGCAGLENESHPLILWDTESGCHLNKLGSNYRVGAGVLNCIYDDSYGVFSCGYDTCLRFWDLRTPCHKSSLNWYEPYDSTMYCVRSDRNNAIFTGQARHGNIHLWDRRNTQKPVGTYFLGKGNSPVYSMEFTPEYLYAALDSGVNVLHL